MCVCVCQVFRVPLECQTVIWNRNPLAIFSSCIVAVTPGHIVAANAGDSRAVLAVSQSRDVQQGGGALAGQTTPETTFGIRNDALVIAHDLTSDHKPGRPDEQQVVFLRHSTCMPLARVSSLYGRSL